MLLAQRNLCNPSNLSQLRLFLQFAFALCFGTLGGFGNMPPNTGLFSMTVNNEVTARTRRRGNVTGKTAVDPKAGQRSFASHLCW